MKVTGCCEFLDCELLVKYYCSCVNHFLDESVFAACPTFPESCLEEYITRGPMGDCGSNGQGKMSVASCKCYLFSLSAILRSGQVQYSASIRPVLWRVCIMSAWYQGDLRMSCCDLHLLISSFKRPLPSCGFQCDQSLCIIRVTSFMYSMRFHGMSTNLYVFFLVSEFCFVLEFMAHSLICFGYQLVLQIHICNFLIGFVFSAVFFLYLDFPRWTSPQARIAKLMETRKEVRRMTTQRPSLIAIQERLWDSVQYPTKCNKVRTWLVSCANSEFDTRLVTHTHK